MHASEFFWHKIQRFLVKFSKKLHVQGFFDIASKREKNAIQILYYLKAKKILRNIYQNDQYCFYFTFYTVK